MTEFQQEFSPLAIEDIHTHAQMRKDEGWRYVQMLAVNTKEDIDLIYSFIKDGFLENNVVKGITKEIIIPSISDLFIEAFVFENETHDLFGVNIQNIAIDFEGAFYSLAVDEPMTIMSPEEYEERKAKRKASKEAADREISQEPENPEEEIIEDIEEVEEVEDIGDIDDDLSDHSECFENLSNDTDIEEGE